MYLYLLARFACIGELMKAIARRLLFLPVLRFVDDYFAAEQEACAKHAMLIFARCGMLIFQNISIVSHLMYRLVRVLLGADSISERKLETGNPLVVLGVQIEAHLGGVVFTPAADKVKKWLLDIQCALKVGRLTSGEASKLAGKNLFISICACNVGFVC